MKEIYFDNKEDLHNIDIHDTYFINIDIDYNNSNLILNLASEKGKDHTGRQYILVFKNIAKFDLSRLCLCRQANYKILEMNLKEYDIQRYIQQYIKDMRKKDYLNYMEKYDIKNSKIKDIIDRLLTIEILVDSGDTVQITCEKVTFLEL